MSDEIKSLSDEVRRTHEEYKSVLAERAAEMKKLGEETAETKAKLAKMDTAFDAAQDTMKEVQQKLARAERADARADLLDRDQKLAAARAEWLDWAAFGEHKGRELKMVEIKSGLAPRVRPSETKVLVESDATAAGIFALPQFMSEVLKGIIEFSPFRQYARTVSTSNLSVRWPKRTGVFAAVWVAESTTRAETTGLTYGNEEIPTHEMQAMVDISNWMLEDSSFDLEGQIGMEANEQFGVAEGTAFLNGDGTVKPEGIITNAAVGTTTVQDSNDLTDWKRLVDIAAVPKTRYLGGSAFYMNRNSISKVRKMIDGASRPIWQPAAGTLAGVAVPQTILGYPVVECPDMDSAGSGKKPIIFGNMSKGYIVVDRTSMISIRDPYTQQASGNVRFWFRRRVGGQVVMAEALRIGT